MNPFERFVSSLKGDGVALRPVVQFYSGMACGSAESAFAAMHDDIVLKIEGWEAVPFVGEWHGKAEVCEAVLNNFLYMDQVVPVVEELVVSTDTVVLVARETGIWRPTGRPYELRWIQIFGILDDKIVSVRELFDSTNLRSALE